MNRFFTIQRIALILLLTVLSLLAVACSGADGATGSTGPQGAAGAQGAAGEAGPAGAAGPRGPAGAAGSAGADGAQGNTGARGAGGGPGIPGDPGPAGPAGADGESGHSNIQLSSTYVEPDVALTIVAFLTGWADGEEVSLQLVADDGGMTAWGSGDANSNGMAMIELSHDGLEAGFYSVVATGDEGGKASDALVAGDKPMAQ